MSLINNIKQVVSANAPEIGIVVGIACFIGSAVMAAKGTPKAQKARLENNEIKETMDQALATGLTASDEIDENGNSVMIPYTEEDYKSDMKLYIGKKIVNETKPYLPAIGLGIAGTASILAGFGLLKKRHAGVVSLLATTSTQFLDYRRRVQEEQGKDKDHYYLTGTTIQKKIESMTGPDGKKQKVEVKEVSQLDTDANCPWLSPYAIKITSANCSQFKSLCGDPIYVNHWLEVMQESVNNHLHTDGILYLDKVLADLGIELDPETNPSLNSFIAHNVGWIDTDYYYDCNRKETFKNEGDRYVDFGCWDDQGKLTLTRGKDGSVYLDFNVDGWINGRIPRKQPKYILDQVEKYPEIEK